MINPDDIAKAAECLRAGELVAFPTETVYGLGGNALSDAAVAAIYAAKGRPSFNPLIVHVASLEEAARYAVCNETALTLAKQYWPGPLTLVLPRRPDCTLSLLVSAGLDSVAIRVPAHPIAQSLLRAAGLPIAAPSANRSGRISPTLASHVREELGEGIMILDGGPCTVGIESTVVDATGEVPVVLRPGSALLAPSPLAGEGRDGGKQSSAHNSQSPHPNLPPQGGKELYRSPGMLESHYAPNKPLRLNATQARAGEAFLAFGSYAGQANLSEKGDLQEAAANLFKMLRALDSSDYTSIAVMPIPEEGLGIAINDRLKRAAAPRN